MTSSEFDDNYLKALERTSAYQKPVGFSKYTPNSETDQTMIKQNNLIIELLVEMASKLDRLLERPEGSKSDIEKLTEQMAKLQPIEPKIISGPTTSVFNVTEYKFGCKKK